jgi:hypothetical protein
MVLGSSITALDRTTAQTNSPTKAFFSQLTATVGGVGKSVLDLIGPASTPSYLVQHDDGAQTYVLNGEPSTGDLANQALALTPFVYRSSLPHSSPRATPKAPTSQNVVRERVLANIAESQAARESSNFTVHRAIEAIYDNARTAVQAAKDAGLTNVFGRLGTRAHQEFQRLNLATNELLSGTGVRLVTETFRNAAGEIVKPRSGGSRGLDVFVEVAGQAYRGFDLKTAGTWAKKVLADVENRFKVPVTQIQK